MISQEELLARIDEIDRRTLALLGDLTPEQLEVPYERGINPPIWELGHAAFFYEFFLLRRLYGVDPIMPGMDSVWDSFDIPHRERWRPGVVPDREKTLAYYRRVLTETIDRLSAGDGLSPEESYLGEYVVAHQCMHIESLIWCRQTLGFASPPFHEMREPGSTAPEADPKRSDVEIPGGTWFIGVPGVEDPARAETFSFDNERPGFEREGEAFAISPTLVSSGEFLEFVEDGGYERPDLWSFGGNYWRREGERKAPAYWRKHGTDWLVRRFDREVPLDPQAPALHVSFWEAEAFCQWAGRRLPTEFEWEIAARGPEGRQLPWDDSGSPRDVDLDGRFLGTAAVDDLPGTRTPTGCLQMIGTAWEWTTSQYLPFDGFCVDMYAYMSTLQFGDHKTTRGGSAATCSAIIRNTYRQAYFPDRTDVFTGFRTCAK